MQRPSMFTTAAAIKAAEYHLARAPSPGLRFYWQSVVDSLRAKAANDDGSER